MSTSPEKTCILSPLKSIYNRILSSEEHDNYLLIFSDMMECCKHGCPDSPEEFKRLTDNLGSYQLDQYKLAQYIPFENISVVYATQGSKLNQGELMESPHFKAFWDSVFVKMGYKSRPVFSDNFEKWLNKLIHSN